MSERQFLALKGKRKSIGEMFLPFERGSIAECNSWWPRKRHIGAGFLGTGGNQAALVATHETPVAGDQVPSNQASYNELGDAQREAFSKGRGPQSQDHTVARVS